MGNELTTKQKSSIPALFDSVGIENISTKDEFTIKYADEFLTMTVKRDDGKVETVRKHVKNPGFSEMTTFDPDRMTHAQRDTVIRRLSDDGLKQNEVAQLTGFSQSTVSNVLRKKG